MLALCTTAITCPTDTVLFLISASALRRQRLHFLRDNGEAAAGFAGTVGLDRGIEREQIGLPRDRGDQRRNLIDVLHRRHQRRGIGDRAVGTARRLLDDVRGIRHLRADVGDRGRQLFDRGGHVGRAFARTLGRGRGGARVAV